MDLSREATLALKRKYYTPERARKHKLLLCKQRYGIHIDSYIAKLEERLAIAMEVKAKLHTPD